MSALFSPTVLRGLNLPNRVAVSPMCQYVAKDGYANAWHVVHLGGLANSGAAALFIEATAVEPAASTARADRARHLHPYQHSRRTSRSRSSTGTALTATMYDRIIPLWLNHPTATRS
jgi:2,4-dienoyl-CoA reductase-like NADH-dependent reductase (Old Yellow Enzyme family)